MRRSTLDKHPTVLDDHSTPPPHPNLLPSPKASSYRMLLEMDRLPAEILGEICSFLCVHCQVRAPDELLFCLTDADKKRESSRDSRALASLCVTSKALRDAATPYLYHLFCHQDHHPASFSLKRMKWLLSIHNALRSRPQLVNCIKVMTLPPHLGSPMIETKDAEILQGIEDDPREREAFLLEARRLEQRLLEDVDLHSFYALLLRSARHLETLRLIFVSTAPGSETIPDLGKGSLPKLRTLHASWNSAVGKLSSLLHLLQAAPHLKTLRLFSPCTLTDDDGIIPQSIDPKLLANITNLTVCMRMVRAPLALSLLEGCAPLLAFNLELPGPGTTLFARLDVARITGDILEKLCERHGTTLESLAITTKYRSYGFYRHCPTHNPLILRGFSNLKSLEIPPTLFMGPNTEATRPDSFFADILPTSLRRLSIAGGVVTKPIRCLSTAHLEGLGVAIDQGRFPYLVTIRVMPWRGGRLSSFRFLDGNIAESWRTRRPGCELITQAPRQLRDYWTF
ncbi:hypothetical protein QBC34DRAFT_201177 [Podospora aff. communis PSN243]|uniref:F-box domain-containing protein n=1 Tax=Podospora aff. communis PSN243 TaxID=3040156 RepID=A0AAV9G651_9PEZI|nr:hypothetical protein QBC34DRAFT_201177 [Podospora aff. communis PSN243]